ncbi:MAG TPA: ATP-binding protein [Candidatus Dormibacteraeota bacterium]
MHRARVLAGDADLTSSRHPGLSVLLTAAVGTLLLLPGLLLRGNVVLSWFVPVCDVAAVLSMATTVVLGSLDTQLREDTRSLPIVTIATAASVLWLGHLITFPGVLPTLIWPGFNDMTSWTFLIISMATPLMLAIALTRRGRHTARPMRSVRWSWLAGFLLGTLGLMLAYGLTILGVHSAAGNAFPLATSLSGAVALAPTAAAMILYLQGNRGDERVISGILAALVLCAFASVALIFLRARYTPVWYALHLLEFLPFAALLFGQLSLYERSVRAERASENRARSTARRLQLGVDVASDLGSSLDPKEVIRRLISHAANAAAADRASLCQVVGNEILVEDSYEASGREDMTPGRRWPIDSQPVLEQAIRTKRAVQGSAVQVESFPPTLREARPGVGRVVAVPLVLAGDVVGVLAMSRWRDTPFTEEDLAIVQQIASIAVLALRNARLYVSADEASRAKSLFLNMAAHELRTPLTVLSGYISMLMDGSLGPPSASWLKTMTMLQAKTSELANLINGILVAARLEAGKLGVRADRLDLDTCVKDAIERFRPSAELVQATLIVEHSESPVGVLADAESVGRILDNLLRNASIYSPGTPWIRVRVTAEARHATLRVEDHGVGVPREMRDRIFERLVRVDHPSLGFPPGTGLGLFIGRTLAEQLGGRLWLETSEPGQGSTFILELPLAPTETEAASLPSGSAMRTEPASNSN